MKQKHTLSNCRQCALDHLSLQESFPKGPVYYTDPIVSFPPNSTSERKVVRLAMKQLDENCMEKFGSSLPDLVAKHCKDGGLQKSKSKVQKKSDHRKMNRQMRDCVSQQLSDSAPLTVLAENESFCSYQRKRLSQSFEKLPPKKRARYETLSQENVDWDADGALTYLRELPRGTKIVWSTVAQKFSIPDKNAGQVLKALASNHGIDVSNLSKFLCRPRSRRSKKRLPWGEISSPSNPPPTAVKQQIATMVESGALTLGETCAPYTLVRYVTNSDGSVISKEVKVHGRKVPLQQLRQKLLQQQEKYMHLLSNEEVEGMNEDSLCEFMKLVHKPIPSQASVMQLQDHIKNAQRTRSLAMWHDHSTVLGVGYIVVTIHTLYDPAVYLSHDKFQRRYPFDRQSIQEIVEMPEIYMIAASTSAQSDQLGLIADRVDCLLELPTPVTASNGVQVNDHMLFFHGDKPAQQFERGTQQGGRYPCGGCGIKDTMIEDQAAALRCTWRSLVEQQNDVTAGVFGKRSMTQQDSMVKRAAAGLKAFGPTKFPKTFIAERTSSWQAHMERISHYLLEGEGIWWKETAMSSSMERMTTTFTLQDRTSNTLDSTT